MSTKQGAPTPPDPKAITDLQTKSNIDTAVAQSTINNVNQNTPWGSLNYSSTKDANGVPTYTQNMSLTPAQQLLLDKQNNAQGALSGQVVNKALSLPSILSTPLGRPEYENYAAGPALATSYNAGGTVRDGYDSGGPIQRQVADAGQIVRGFGDAGQIRMGLSTNDYSADRTKVEEALFARLNPQIERDRATLDAKLSNQGIALGSDAYKAAQGNFGQDVNDARLGTILSAGQEQNRLQALDLNAGNFQNSAQAQNYGQVQGRAAFTNAAQGQQYGQNLASGQFANAAQDQQNQQNAEAAVFGNSAQAQRNGQNAAAAGFGNSTAQQMFANQTAVTAANNSNRDSTFQNNMAGNTQRINELNSLMAMSRGQQPQFAPTTQTGVAGSDIAGLYNSNYQNLLNSYNQSQSDTIGGIAGLGSAALGMFSFSDRRLKENVRSTGSRIAGVPVVEYDRKDTGQHEIGVIAQAVEKKHPELVARGPGGMRMVNYQGLGRIGGLTRGTSRRAA